MQPIALPTCGDVLCGLETPGTCPSTPSLGFASGLINVWPERSLAIHTTLQAGKYAEANPLIADMKAFEDIRCEEMNGANVTGVKAALLALGAIAAPRGRLRPGR